MAFSTPKPLHHNLACFAGIPGVWRLFVNLTSLTIAVTKVLLAMSFGLRDEGANSGV